MVMTDVFPNQKKMSRKLGKITRMVVEIEDTSKTGGSHFLARKNLTSIFHTTELTTLGIANCWV
jgi:hypothetical protein